MGKIVFMLSVSLDGYFEGPECELDWHRIDHQLHTHFNELTRSMGAFLEGRRTWELMAEFWPTVDTGPTSSGPEAEFAPIWLNMPKYVFSRTLDHADWNTTVVREVIPEEIEALRTRHQGDLAIGGPELASAFAALDLIDEYRIYVHPVLLGHGHLTFTDWHRGADLRLLSTTAFDNGVVLLHYERDRATAQT